MMSIIYGLLSIVLTSTVVQVETAIINRYQPMMSSNAETINIQRNIPLKMEILASKNADARMKRVARQAIMNNYTGSWPDSGHESNAIEKEMAKNFHGYWMVGIFDSEYDVAYTIIRRSPAYIVYGVNDRTILIAKEGNGQPINTEEIII